MLYNKRNEYIKEGQIVYNKKRDILAFAVFFIGLWSIPFWYPFIIEYFVDIFFNSINIETNNIVYNTLVCIYGVLNVLAGITGIKENEWYIRMFSILSIIIGIGSTIFLIFGV